MSCVNQHVVMALVPKRQCNYQARNACVFQELNHKNQSIGADQQTCVHCLSRCTLVTFLPLVRLCMMFKLALRAICTNRLSTLYYKYYIILWTLYIVYLQQQQPGQMSRLKQPTYQNNSRNRYIIMRVCSLRFELRIQHPSAQTRLCARWHIYILNNVKRKFKIQELRL